MHNTSSATRFSLARLTRREKCLLVAPFLLLGFWFCLINALRPLFAYLFIQIIRNISGAKNTPQVPQLNARRRKRLLARASTGQMSRPKCAAGYSEAVHHAAQPAQLSLSLLLSLSFSLQTYPTHPHSTIRPICAHCNCAKAWQTALPTLEQAVGYALSNKLQQNYGVYVCVCV